MNKNSLDFNFYRSGTASARGEKGTPAPSTYFGAFRMVARDINTTCRNDRNTIENEIKELSATLNRNALFARRSELESAFNAVVHNKQEFLLRILDKLIDSKKEAIKQFTVTPPSADHITLIESAEKRIDSISETEWLMIVETVANNYQESALLHDIAEKHGKSYKLPYEPEQANADLDELRKRMKAEVIDHIGEDPSINMQMFFNHKDDSEIYGRLNELCVEFDELPVNLVENPIVELTNTEDLETRVNNARYTAYKANDKELWNQLVTVSFSIKEGINDNNLHEAERLISLVNAKYPDGVGDQ